VRVLRGGRVSGWWGCKRIVVREGAKWGWERRGVIEYRGCKRGEVRWWGKVRGGRMKDKRARGIHSESGRGVLGSKVQIRNRRLF
jgi:hypothetical protein